MARPYRIRKRDHHQTRKDEAQNGDKHDLGASLAHGLHDGGREGTGRIGEFDLAGRIGAARIVLVCIHLVESPIL